MNQVILYGHLQQDPDFKTTQSGISVCNLVLVTTKFVRSKDGPGKEVSEWHKVVVWGKQAELCREHLRAGSKLLVHGELRTDSYEKDGKKNYITKIQADRVYFGQDQKFRQKTETAPAQTHYDDMPF